MVECSQILYVSELPSIYLSDYFGFNGTFETVVQSVPGCLPEREGDRKMDG